MSDGASPAPLPPVLVERVLEKLGLSTRPTIDLAGLRCVYSAWCERVPFDNVRKRIHLQRNAIGVLPGDEPHDFLRGWVLCGTGGTCWAGNGALAALLADLGFETSLGIATMHPEGSPPNHGTVAVELDAERYLVDASILCPEPVRLQPGEATRVDHPAWGIDVRPEGDRFVVRWHVFNPADEWLDCRIEHFGASQEEFSKRHETTRAWSPFNQALSARLVRGDGVIGSAFGLRGEISPEGKPSLRPFEDGERVRFLVEELGIAERVAHALPEDEPMTPPPTP